MRVSIITVAYNAADTIEETIRSVASQTYPDVEHIVVDGGSTDGTVDIIESYKNRIACFITEPDDGIYDAMNKGISRAKGDIVGILHADDTFCGEDALSAVVAEFQRTGADSIFSDLVYVRRNDPNRIVRYYCSKPFSPRLLAYGWMPPHPTFFVCRRLFELYGGYKTEYRIAADFELIARFIGANGISYSYLPRVLVKMKIGGKSTRNLKSIWIPNREIVLACRENSISTNMLKVLSRYLMKIPQLVSRPPVLPE